MHVSISGRPVFTYLLSPLSFLVSKSCFQTLIRPPTEKYLDENDTIDKERFICSAINSPQIVRQLYNYTLCMPLGTQTSVFSIIVPYYRKCTVILRMATWSRTVLIKAPTVTWGDFMGFKIAFSCISRVKTP